MDNNNTFEGLKELSASEIEAIEGGSLANFGWALGGTLAIAFSPVIGVVATPAAGFAAAAGGVAMLGRVQHNVNNGRV